MKHFYDFGRLLLQMLAVIAGFIFIGFLAFLIYGLFVIKASFW